MFELSSSSVGGQELFVLPFGDIVDYFTPYTTALFLFALVFTLICIFSKPEKQLDVAFGTDAIYAKDVTGKELHFRRFMAIACGFATMGAVASGDVFNFTLFVSMVGVCIIGIVAAVKSKHVLNAAYNYGIISMLATVPLFGGAAITLATTGTLSIWELAAIAPAMPWIAKALILIGVMGEGIAPFYAAKAELFRAPGAPYVIMIHVSSLLMFLRVVEIMLTV
ncbi:proton-conducting transporter transmembrane domain-containing protein [Methanogenium organophilum]|uniref:Proton-conducting transporter membrane subunit n=1 Tax=Methanogenium organophilum TaxID=2199 RepID=A0A9X9T794_METOG|nr:proton-conducting transporter membrane subunit [Methanogenium organophilum]WAI01118.1 proton-conducting transporter membrane subunit [Methanogenium organophilum]